MVPCRHNPLSKVKAPLQLYISIHHDVKKGRTIFPTDIPAEAIPMATERLSVNSVLITTFPEM